MEARRGESFFKSIRKEVAGVMAGLAGLGAAAEAGAQDRKVPDKFEDAFEEMEQETASATEADVQKGLERFQTRIVMAVGAEKARGVVTALENELKQKDLSPDEKKLIIDLYYDRLVQLLSKKEEQSEETEFGKIVKKGLSAQKELNENVFGIGGYFDESVSFEDSVKALDALIKKGISVEYNGVRFVKDKDGNLFCEGKPVTPDSRKNIINAYKAVQERLKSEGAELH